jgi:hypothetical protein
MAVQYGGSFWFKYNSLLTADHHFAAQAVFSLLLKAVHCLRGYYKLVLHAVQFILCSRQIINYGVTTIVICSKFGSMLFSLLTADHHCNLIVLLSGRAYGS